MSFHTLMCILISKLAASPDTGSPLTYLAPFSSTQSEHPRLGETQCHLHSSIAVRLRFKKLCIRFSFSMNDSARMTVRQKAGLILFPQPWSDNTSSYSTDPGNVKPH